VAKKPSRKVRKPARRLASKQKSSKTQPRTKLKISKRNPKINLKNN
jgi:hypothetical protein